MQPQPAHRGFIVQFLIIILMLPAQLNGQNLLEEQDAYDTRISLSSSSEDRASTQGIFFPGPGFSGRLLNDYRWTLKLNLSQARTISSILIEHHIAGEAWTTSSSRRYGKDLYPIVVVMNGAQLNHKYDDTIGPLLPGENILELYGQVESHPFSGGTVRVEFTDGTARQATIPPASLPVAPLLIDEMFCSDSDGGANYERPGTISWQLNGKSFTFTDYCLSDRIVAEGLCGGADRRGLQFVMSHGPCQGACFAGACQQGPAKADFEGRLMPLGWVFTFHTARQRSIEGVVLYPKTRGLRDPAYQVEGRSAPLEVIYQGKPLRMGNGGDSQIFEPGAHTLTILLPRGEQGLSGGRLLIVFTDGTRYEQQFE